MRQPEMVKEGSAVMIVDRSYFGTDKPTCSHDSWQARASAFRGFRRHSASRHLPFATGVQH